MNTPETIKFYKSCIKDWNSYKDLVFSKEDSKYIDEKIKELKWKITELKPKKKQRVLM